MKAIVYRRYGSPDVLSYEEMAKPAPAENEVLIRVARRPSIHTTGTS
jgi:NADPH:quinone reductase-like Zn-dependent oxidoreductase